MEYNCVGDKFCSSAILEIDSEAKIAEREVHWEDDSRNTSDQ